MDNDDKVSELLTKAKRFKAMAESACSPEYKRLLAEFAADYELLASCRETLLDTRRRLVASRRLLSEFYRMRNGTMQ